MSGKERAYPANLAVIAAAYAVALAALIAATMTLEELDAPSLIVLTPLIALPIAFYAAAGLAAFTNDTEQFSSGMQRPGRISTALAAAPAMIPGSVLFTLAGSSFLLGHDTLAVGIGWMAGLALTSVAITPALRRTGTSAVTDYFAHRYGLPVARLAGAIVIGVALLLLTTELSFAGRIGEKIFGIAPHWTIGIVLFIALLVTVPGGTKGTNRTGFGQSVVLLSAFCVPLFLLSANVQGPSLPFISYGNVLPQITDLETDIIEQGLATLDTFAPNTTPFLQLEPLNFFAIGLCLMAGIAAMPHIAGHALGGDTTRGRSLSSAWCALFALVPLLAIPAFANYTKFETYRLIAAPTQLNALPSWMETASRFDLLRIHGVSLKLLEDIRTARERGVSEIGGIGKHLERAGTSTANAWKTLEMPVRIALFETAGAASERGPPKVSWRHLTMTVLPAAANAAGDETGLLTHNALKADPTAIMVLAAAMTGTGHVALGLILAGAIAAILATASALLLTIATTLPRPQTSSPPGAEHLNQTRAALIFSSIAVAVLAAFFTPDIVPGIVGAFSISAAALFPALFMGLWWKPANTLGAAAGMTAGLLISATYLIGTQIYPVALFETTQTLSNASEFSSEEFASLKNKWSAASNGEARIAARHALDIHARGTQWHTGVANWFGVHGAAAALFGLPAGLFALVIFSALSRGRHPNIEADTAAQLSSPGEKR
jgi:cation/acetate symporter